jgi:hypothetical protein
LPAKAAAWFGSPITDCRTGERLGKAFLVSWRGKVFLLGYRGEPVQPVFQAQKRTNYWKMELGFTTHPEPDFPSLLRENAPKGGQK